MTPHAPFPPPRATGFCERMWHRATPLVDAICAHPFICALADGTLERDTFLFYLVQDARYLTGFSRALATASTRAPDPADATFLAASAHQALTVERELHARYLQAHGVGVDDAVTIETSPSCLAYTSYLQAVALHEPFAVLIAALLPCFWVYQHVGETIVAGAAPDAAHPYRAWINTYADEQFAAAAQRLREMTDKAATAHPAAEAAMRDSFMRSTSYEWMFWDSAWRRESWPTARWECREASARQPDA